MEKIDWRIMKRKVQKYLLIISFITYTFLFINLFLRMIHNNKKNEYKNYATFILNMQWIHNLQVGKSISNYLTEKGFREIAIYGMGDLGKALLNELNKSGIIVSYVIDKNAGEIFLEIPVITPDSEFESVDAVIVTPFLQFEPIKEMLRRKINCPILSIADIINNL